MSLSVVLSRLCEAVDRGKMFRSKFQLVVEYSARCDSLEVVTRKSLRSRGDMSGVAKTRRLEP